MCAYALIDWLELYLLKWILTTQTVIELGASSLRMEKKNVEKFAVWTSCPFLNQRIKGASVSQPGADIKQRRIHQPCHSPLPGYETPRTPPTSTNYLFFPQLCGLKNLRKDSERFFAGFWSQTNMTTISGAFENGDVLLLVYISPRVTVVTCMNNLEKRLYGQGARHKPGCNAERTCTSERLHLTVSSTRPWQIIFRSNLTTTHVYNYHW